MKTTAFLQLFSWVCLLFCMFASGRGVCVKHLNTCKTSSNLSEEMGGPWPTKMLLLSILCTRTCCIFCIYFLLINYFLVWSQPQLVVLGQFVTILPVVPARGGAEVALGIYHKTFLIHRTCTRRAPAKPVRALCEAVAQMLSKNMTCARPLCNAMPSEDFPHTSHCTLHTSHSTLHLISDHVSSSHLISPHLSSSHLIASHMSSKKVLLNCWLSLHKALPSTTLYYKACTKSFPVLLCTTRLAQSTSQYYSLSIVQEFTV